MPKVLDPDRGAHRRRQDPVSCRLCRTKKLKCDRENPCSNCAARGLPCDGSLKVSRAPSRRVETNDSNTAILARLNRLEELVSSQHDASSAPRTFESLSSDAAPKSFALDTPMSLEQSSTPSRASADDPERHDSTTLERIGTNDHVKFAALPEFLQVRVQTLWNPQDPTSICIDSAGYRIWLPPRRIADKLFTIYATNIAYLHHIVHLPTAEAHLDRVYTKSASSRPVDPGQVALLVSIFACTAHSWNIENGNEEVFGNPQAAVDSADLWVGCGLRMLQHLRLIDLSCLEGIQSSIILAFMLLNMEGFSGRLRGMMAGVIASAREIGLHRVDQPTGQLDAVSPADALELEYKRRVWWHVASSDWILSLQSGPHERTYHISPHHMIVRRPRNISDKDLEICDADFNQPSSVPTPMSYFVQRIRLSELCRDIVDAMPFTLSDYSEVDYQQVINLDKQFEAFEADLPVFFRLDAASRQQSADLHRRYPYIAIQRYIVNIGFWTRRCKLHQPFLTRGSLEGKYSFSREMCLRCVRSAIAMKHELDGDETMQQLNPWKFGGFIHAIFLAMVILAMDLCFTKDQVAREQLKAEVIDAIEILERAKAHSPAANKYLESLMDVLRKHNIRLKRRQPEERTGGVQEAAPKAHEMPTPASSTSVVDTAFFESTSMSFDDIWQEYMAPNADMDATEWDRLFSELDLPMG